MWYTAILIHIRSQGKRIYLQGRLLNGRSFGIVCTQFRPYFFVHSKNIDDLKSYLGSLNIGWENVEYSGWRTMWQKNVHRISFRDHAQKNAAHKAAQSAQIPCYEGDLNSTQQFLIENKLRILFQFRGRIEKGRTVDIRCIDPELICDHEKIIQNLNYDPRSNVPEYVRVVSVDIETSRAMEIRCISMSSRPCMPSERIQSDRIPRTQSAPIHTILSNSSTRGLSIRSEINEEYENLNIIECANEADLLREFVRSFREIDPDIITGWNVISFDFKVMLQRMKKLSVSADLGRSNRQSAFLAGVGDQPDVVDMDGRQVIDALRLYRFEHYDSQSLENAAFKILGQGKREKFSEDNKMDRLDELWENNLLDFLLYCLEDSVLVLKILNANSMLNLTIQRSLLCGTSLSRAWGSVHSFEQLYIPALHDRKIAAPDRGVDRLPLNESPGGTIIQPESALFNLVLLLDFKGLYPSIMRSFGIDPLAHISALAKIRGNVDLSSQEESNAGADIPAGAHYRGYVYSPNKAVFLRGVGILPYILNEFYDLREQAKQQGDETASYAYKILANSFYGVLGTANCRFAGSDLATAITAHAKEILLWSKDYVERRGYTVVYGDTDSLFLVPSLSYEAEHWQKAEKQGQRFGVERVHRQKHAEEHIHWHKQTEGQEPILETAFQKGKALCSELNHALAQWIKEQYNCQSYLEIELEKVFSPLYIPPLKSVSSQAIQEMLNEAGLKGPQGRAKNYAGLAYSTGSALAPEFVIKGMEAVRSDWTVLARRVQSDVMHKILAGKGAEDIRSYLDGIIRIIKQPTTNEARELLVIQKRLSKAPTEYRAGLPPHVRAALIAEKNAERERGRQKQGQGGHGQRTRLKRIRYVMTQSGPQPVKDSTALHGEFKPDLEWYVEKQIIPVLQSINSAVSYDLSSIVKDLYKPDGQLRLI